MDIKTYLGKKINVPTTDSDLISVFDKGKEGKLIEILAWADENSNFAALNVLAKNGVIKKIYREEFCWMCPEGKSCEKRISKFPTQKAEKDAEKELKKLLS